MGLTDRRGGRPGPRSGPGRLGTGSSGRRALEIIAPVIGELRAATRTRQSPLDDRRFRTVLLAIAGVPIAGMYLWLGFLQPILRGAYLGDFQESYLRAAQHLAAGRDPYDLCQKFGCLEPTGPQYVTPPLLAWLLQPIVGLDAHVISIATIVVLNASLAGFLWFLLKAMRVDDWQLAVLLVLVVLSFEPVAGNLDELLPSINSVGSYFRMRLTELAQKYVQGLPQTSRITLCPIYASSTRGEAQDVARCLQSTDGRKILLVTSDYHTRRALLIFNRVAPAEYSVAAASDPREFGVQWWQHRQWAKTNAEEWAKLAWWELVDRWR